jgi:hypothetical protein
MSEGETHWPTAQLAEQVVKLRAAMQHRDPPPPEVIAAERTLQPYTGHLVLAIDQYAAVTVPDGQTRLAAMWAVAQKRLEARPYPAVPTAEELASIERNLRTRVLPETPGEELAEAVAAIPADPEKVKTAAWLAELVRQTTGLPAPWAAFVFSFGVALALNPDVTGALALAFAVYVYVQQQGGKPKG